MPNTYNLHPIEYGDSDRPTVNETGRPFARFGIALPVLVVGLVPALLLMVVAKQRHIHWLFTGASILVIALIVLATGILVISGIYGAVEYRRYRKLAAGINARR